MIDLAIRIVVCCKFASGFVVVWTMLSIGASAFGPQMAVADSSQDPSAATSQQDQPAESESTPPITPPQRNSQSQAEPEAVGEIESDALFEPEQDPEPAVEEEGEIESDALFEPEQDVPSTPDSQSRRPAGVGTDESQTPPRPETERNDEAVDGAEQAAPLDQPTPDATPEPLESDGPRYQVNKLILVYANEHPGLPSLEELGQVGIKLSLTETGYVAARPGVPSVYVPLVSIDDELPHLPQYWFYASAIQKMAEAIVELLNSRGLIGVFVSPDPDQIEDGEDERSEGQTSLRMLIRTVVLADVRTLASGDRVSVEERINNPVHQRIKDNSPVLPFSDDQAQRRDLLRRDLLDDYVFRLNRLPGRRVDVAVSRAQKEGGIVLDYLVAENRPLMVYFQVSNTGTEQTDQWRERFGIVHNQLTNHDDIFSIDYVTAGFDESHSLVVSYEAPVGHSERLHWRVFGSWGEFTASDVGSLQDQFIGDSWSYGGELIANIFQHRDLFVDLVFGLRQEQIFVDNRVTSDKGRDDFFFFYFGLNLERVAEVSSSLASVTVERNDPGFANTDQRQIDNFGRTNPDRQWTLLKWNGTHSFYLEPLIDQSAWADFSSPETSTLAHEIAISFKGQHSFGSRLVPQMEQVAGGLYTVRGYEESAAAGDTVLIASVEYRYHIPRAFNLQPNPSKTPLFGKPFRFAPQQVYGRPDWDLIFRTFFDAAWVTKADRRSVVGEENQRLLGMGIGLEFQLQRYFNIRVDWAAALEEAGEVQDGSEQVHIVATLLF